MFEVVSTLLGAICLVLFAALFALAVYLIFNALGLTLRHTWKAIPIGTRSVLIGAHCFFLHPWLVALGWWKLYGFPLDPRLWVAFFIHDLGYWGMRLQRWSKLHQSLTAK